MIYFRETLPTVNGVWLVERIDAEAVNFIEVCSDPDDTIYRFGHIPGGNRFFWKDLCWHKTGHEFVTP
ncbi:MAG: hypothetical protein VYE18_05300, partial [Pseudomonadota bacterium]|nr:hypothetical protein [Pseudomonadota bacterium]